MSPTNPPSRRRFLRQSLDFGLLTILASTFSAGALAAEKKPAGGTISVMKGKVFVNGKSASATTPIPSNAEIRTGSRSMVAFSAGGDAHVLKSNTSITLSSSGGFTDQLRLLTGALLSAWGERPAGRQARLSTGTATIGIRGTVTYCTVGKFSLLQGAVEYTYTDKGGQSKTVTLKRDDTGKAVSVDEKGAVIDWVPPISKEEVKALQESIAQAIADGKADPVQSQKLIDALTEQEGIIEELGERTASGELVIDVPPTGGNASPD